MSRGRLALVLHSHMPYVEGFGTWPFGEEWLFEAIATSYLPLADVVADSGVTVSVTPVLADQLTAPGLDARLGAFLGELRPATHADDAAQLRREGNEAEARELERAAGDYARAHERLSTLGAAGLLEALDATWTSSATHAVLPLCATEAGVRLQLRVGIEAHRARAGGWGGGLWLPECAYAPWLDPLLEQAGVHAVCVDLTDVLGRGAPAQLQPLATADGPLLVPIDRTIMELIWSPKGYPSGGAYREYHRRTAHDHHPWAIDGAVYDPARAREQCRTDAAHFVATVASRLADGGLCVCALDTELLGHWWYEGPWWLAEVVAECRRRGVELVELSEALSDIQPANPLDPALLGTTSWGKPRDLTTWDAPAVAELAWRTRAGELAVVAAGPHPPPRAVRELLALQSSDWAFLVTGGQAGDYPRERFAGHDAALQDALSEAEGRGVGSGALRHLAPLATPATLAVT